MYTPSKCFFTSGYNDPGYYYPHKLHFGSWVSEAGSPAASLGRREQNRARNWWWLSLINFYFYPLFFVSDGCFGAITAVTLQAGDLAKQAVNSSVLFSLCFLTRGGLEKGEKCLWLFNGVIITLRYAYSIWQTWKYSRVLGHNVFWMETALTWLRPYESFYS